MLAIAHIANGAVRFFGHDLAFLSVGSDDLPGVQRWYFTFSQAAWESGVSRILGGIHWWSGNLYGLSIAADIGDEVVDSLLQPLD